MPIGISHFFKKRNASNHSTQARESPEYSKYFHLLLRI